jgi:catechol 2,3-dioxygenase-like lactoylglutathione lyase family enzyme
MWNAARMSPIARLSWTAIDCPAPRRLAEFYSAITGWPIDEDTSSERWVELRSDGGATICFQRVEDYVPPQWPGQEHPQQEHLDFEVDDLDVAEAQLLAIGARKHSVQPGTLFRVYLDPDDHPFCLILRYA